MILSLVYAALIGTATMTLLHETATTTGATAADTFPLDHQQRERALRAEAGVWKAFLLALPWILILDPSSGHMEYYFAALLLNVATVYGIAAWVIPLPASLGQVNGVLENGPPTSRTGW